MTRCRRDCPYEPMYAASQRSLEQLARSKEGAVARADRLRTGIFAALRQHYPRAYADAARKAPDGLSRVPDEVVLAYLNGFLGAAPENVASRAGAAAAGLAALRTALTGAGFVLPPADDPAAWAAAVAARPSPPRPEASEEPEAPVDVAPAASAAVFADDLFDMPPEPDWDEPAPPDDVYGEQPSAAGLDSSLFDPPPVSPEPPAEAAAPPVAGEAPAAVKGPSRPATSGLQPALLPPSSPTPKNTRRRRRAGESMSSPADGAAPVSEPEVAAKLTAAVSTARPVFFSDLAAMVGDHAAAAWIATAAVADPPLVRIVGAKDHHRARGDLVVAHTGLVPGLGAAYADSVWGRCAAGLRGARLYEAGVALSVYPQARTLAFDQSVTTITADDASHLVGLVLVPGSDLPSGSAARRAACDAVGSLLDRRMQRIVVVAAGAARKAPADVAEALAAEAGVRGWPSDTPVLAVRSADLGHKGAAMVSAFG